MVVGLDDIDVELSVRGGDEDSLIDSELQISTAQGIVIDTEVMLARLGKESSEGHLPFLHQVHTAREGYTLSSSALSAHSRWVAASRPFCLRRTAHRIRYEESPLMPPDHQPCDEPGRSELASDFNREESSGW